MRIKFNLKRIIFLVFISILVFGAFSVLVSAVKTPRQLEYVELPLYIDSEWIGMGYVIDAVPYVPLLSFTEYLLQERCEAAWEQETRTATITAGTLTLRATAGKHYMSANDRFFYFSGGSYNINGTILVPLTVLAKIFSLELSADTAAWRLQIDLGNIRLPDPGEEVYNETDLFWLSRVISAEARTQSLEGMIGVGAVVVNRVGDQSGEFENSITGVIFQEGQFDVVALGTIYEEPVEAAIIAAKLCLEGYSTVGNSLWFVNPQAGNAHWFDIHQTYVTTIADHLFYR